MEKQYKKGILIYSGGLDTTTLLYYLNKHSDGIQAVSFDYGQKQLIELEYAKWHCNNLGIKHTVINLQPIFREVASTSALLGSDVEVPTLDEVIGDPQPITYVPFRNQIMLTVAATIAEMNNVEVIYYGAQKHDEYSGYWDTTTEFTNKLSDVFALNRKIKIIVEAPFVDKSKSDLVLIGTELGVDYTKTMTCYNGNDCGACPTCGDRIAAFKRVGLEDPKTYGAKLN